MKVRNSNTKMTVNMTYGLCAKSWAEEHSNDFSDIDIVDIYIENGITEPYYLINKIKGIREWKRFFNENYGRERK